MCLGFCKNLSYCRTTDLIKETLHSSDEETMKGNTLADFVERMSGDIQNMKGVGNDK